MSVDALKARLERYPRVDWPRPESSDGIAPRTTTAVKDVEKGRLGSAARRLAGTAAVATVDGEVVAALQDKHPPGAADPFGPTDGPSSGDIPTEEETMAAFKTFKPDTSPGLSGWTHHLLATALRVPAFLKAIHTLTGLIVAGTAPGQAMLCVSRLTPLRKPDGGLRPIAVGDMIYRLMTKAIIRHSSRRDFLLPYQFGVGSKGGVEPVVRAIERAPEDTLDQPYTHLTSLDFSNAFNTVDRRDIAEGLRQFNPLTLSLVREVDLIGVLRYANTYREALSLLGSGLLGDVGSMVTHRYPLERAVEAFEDLKRGKDKDGRTVIKPMVGVLSLRYTDKSRMAYYATCEFALPSLYATTRRSV